MHDSDAPPSLEGFLDEYSGRLAELLRGAGRHPFLEGPIVLPDDEWFPDRWTPDIESVRRIAVRLLAYAGLGHLQAECTGFGLHRSRSFPSPLHVAERPSERGAAAVFFGISEDCAYFGVELNMLDRPQVLVGTMAHEVAHAWRLSHELEVENAAEEERLTDLTTVVLGFGVLSANAAYLYETDHEVRGGMTMHRSAHFQTGYVGPDRLAWLLAIQCVVRGLDGDPIRSRLGTTQRSAFDEVVRAMSRDALHARLELHDVRPVGDWEQGKPPSVEIRPGWAVRTVVALGERAREQVRGENQLLDRPLVFEPEIVFTRHHWLATLGRPHIDGGWRIDLVLVEVPDCERVLLVGALHERGARTDLVFGQFEDRCVRKKTTFFQALSKLFDPEHGKTLALTEPPSFAHVYSRRLLGIDELRDILAGPVMAFGADCIYADTLELEAGRRSLARVRGESEGGPREPAPGGFDLRRGYKQWWMTVSDRWRVDDESSTFEAIENRIARER